MMKNSIHNKINLNYKQNKKQLAVLIDPDNCSKKNYLKNLISKSNKNKIDYFFIGGSLISKGNIQNVINIVKKESDIPCVLFPSSVSQIIPEIDAILFLSLISGRNANNLIGEQVLAAPIIKSYGIEPISTGYMLIDCGPTTTAIYMSNALPIPYNKPEIATATALAGNYLGFKLIYLDGGSGASKPISLEMIKEVRSTINIPIIVGGGIQTPKQAKNIFTAGADIIVIGNTFEKSTKQFDEIASQR